MRAWIVTRIIGVHGALNRAQVRSQSVHTQLVCTDSWYWMLAFTDLCHADCYAMQYDATLADCTVFLLLLGHEICVFTLQAELTALGPTPLSPFNFESVHIQYKTLNITPPQADLTALGPTPPLQTPEFDEWVRQHGAMSSQAASMWDLAEQHKEGALRCLHDIGGVDREFSRLVLRLVLSMYGECCKRCSTQASISCLKAKQRSASVRQRAPQISEGQRP